MRQGQKRDFARQLRRSMTDAERRLWYHLRNRALMSWKFRRQYPVGPYITDFACIEARVLVELDGGQHAFEERDAIRDSFLQAQGYHVLRFWNNDALERTEAVLELIHATLVSGGPHPNPSPAGGRGA